MRLLLIALSLVCCSATQAQNTWGNWLMYFGNHRLNAEWSIHSEVQHRNYTVAPNNLEQLLLRTGVNYHFASGNTLTAGYGHITNHALESAQDGPETTEHRIWQQFLRSHRLGRLKLEHRARTEQRFVNADFKTRYRYRLMGFWPLKAESIGPGVSYLGLYNEIFVNPTNAPWDRNRLFACVGYQASAQLNFQMGVLHQAIHSANGWNGSWYAQIGVFLNTPWQTD